VQNVKFSLDKNNNLPNKIRKNADKIKKDKNRRRMHSSELPAVSELSSEDHSSGRKDDNPINKSS